jgi:hypothetical protein
VIVAEEQDSTEPSPSNGTEPSVTGAPGA